MNITKKALTIICVAALLCSASLVMAWSVLTSAPVTITVTAQPSAVVLTVDKTGVLSGESIQFTAQLNQPVAGADVQLYVGETLISGAMAQTDATGKAVINYVPTVSGAYTVKASP